MPRSEAFEYYGQKHTELCTEFIIESAKRAGYDELIRRDGVRKSEFVRYLKESK